MDGTIASAAYSVSSDSLTASAGCAGCLPPALEAPAQGDNVMEDADGARGASLPGSPHRDSGAPLHETSLGSLLVTANGNGHGNGFLYEHVPAASESALDAAVQDVVVSDASAGKPLTTRSSSWILLSPPNTTIRLQRCPSGLAVGPINKTTTTDLSAASTRPSESA